MPHLSLLPRRRFLRTTTAALAAGFLGQRLLAAPATAPRPLHLKSWEVVELPRFVGRSKQVMKVTATTGAWGVAKLIAGCRDLRAVEAIGRQTDLLDHEALYDQMVRAGVAHGPLATFDLACWDLHARLLNQPLHALLGTKRRKVLRYGDVRGQQPDFSPERYAATVATYLQRTKLSATKLHFPGAMRNDKSLEFKQVLQTLRAVRKAVGPDKILAWDPYPGSAESATPSLDEAREILALMDELNYAWIEGPLPPTPFETQVPKYVALREGKPRLRIQAEGPGSPIGDHTALPVLRQWVEAGAVNQCSTDAYLVGGLTHALRCLAYARQNPVRKLVINLHWAWAPHAHLAMATEEALMPIVEFPMVEDVPKSCLDGPHLLAPDWPGLYKLETA